MIIEVTEELYQGISRFYEAISKRPKDDFQFELLSLFPDSCCEYASLFLAKFLVKNWKNISITVVTGEDKKNIGSRHVWLIIDGINVDITANQFDSSLPPILIYQGNGWHKKFKIVKKSKFNPEFYNDYHEDLKQNVMDDYAYLEGQALNIPRSHVGALTFLRYSE